VSIAMLFITLKPPEKIKNFDKPILNRAHLFVNHHDRYILPHGASVSKQHKNTAIYS
jgi:hypothetical protein